MEWGPTTKDTGKSQQSVGSDSLIFDVFCLPSLFPSGGKGKGTEALQPATAHHQCPVAHATPLGSNCQLLLRYKNKKQAVFSWKELQLGCNPSIKQFSMCECKTRLL